MDNVVAGVIVFAVATGIVALLMARVAIAHARSPDGKLLARLAPFLVADGLLFLVLVLFLISQ